MRTNRCPYQEFCPEALGLIHILNLFEIGGATLPQVDDRLQVLGCEAVCQSPLAGAASLSSRSRRKTGARRPGPVEGACIGSARARDWLRPADPPGSITSQQADLFIE